MTVNQRDLIDNTKRKLWVFLDLFTLLSSIRGFPDLLMLAKSRKSIIENIGESCAIIIIIIIILIIIIIIIIYGALD